MPARFTPLAALLPLLLQPSVHAEDATSQASPDSVNAQTNAQLEKAKSLAADFDAKNKLEVANDPNFLLRPSLLADKKSRAVRVMGYATSLKPGEPVEFYVISPNSAKAYESVTVSLAKAADIDAALKHIGLTPGRPVNYARNQLWPRGPRVKLTFLWNVKSPDGTLSPRKVPAEDILTFRPQPGAANPQANLPQSGLTYTGGLWLDPEPAAVGGGNEKRFAADFTDPGSIASNYNEPTTLLDLPFQARQSAVYSSRTLNPTNAPPPGTPLELLFEPEGPEGAPPREVDLKITALAGADFANLKWKITQDDMSSTSGLDTVISIFDRLSKDRREPFVQLTFSDDTSLASAVAAAKLFSSLEAPNGIRLEPAPDELFPEAFLPDERQRDYKTRHWQPFELHLTAAGGAGGATFREFEETEAGPDKWKVKDTPQSTPTDLLTTLKSRTDQRRPLLIYLPEKAPYSTLRQWTQPLLKDDPSAVIWIYTEK